MPADHPATPPMTRISRRLAEAGLRLKKSLGQNFLVNQPVLEKIAAALGATGGSLVLEIGCGLGNLTQILARGAGTVVAVELDERFRPLHERELGGLKNVSILYADFLEIRLKTLLVEQHHSTDIRVIGNVPYHLTSPILFKLMASPVPFSCVCLLLQREVGERLAAPPGSRRYGILAAKVRTRFDIETVLSVSPGSFQPPPKVHSVLVRMTPRAEGDLIPNAEERQAFFNFVDAAFAQRRKFVANSLAAASRGMLERGKVEEAIARLGLRAGVRAEALSCGQLLALFRELGGPALEAVRKAYES